MSAGYIRGANTPSATKRMVAVDYFSKPNISCMFMIYYCKINIVVQGLKVSS